MGNQDYGIKIVEPGSSIANAKPAQVIMDTANPFIKIDTQNPAGFQTTLLLITNEPPYGGSGFTYTNLYNFKHGYTYVPSLESLFFIKSSPNGSGTQPYFIDYGFIYQFIAGVGCALYAVADATYVYIMCVKNNAGAVSGTTVQITTHVFVESGTA